MTRLALTSVAERHGHAVELVFADVADLGVLAGEGTGAAVPVAQFLFAGDVVEREHGAGVRNLGKSFFGLAAYALRGRVGSDQLRVLGFELLELAHQGVEFGVGDLGGVEAVIEVFVVTDGLAEFLDLVLDGLWTHGSD